MDASNSANAVISLLQVGWIALENSSSDYMTPNFQFESPFMIHFPSKEEWERSEVVGKYLINVFKNGMRGTGPEAFVDLLEIE